jgi:hypothetical protein
VGSMLGAGAGLLTSVVVRKKGGISGIIGRRIPRYAPRGPVGRFVRSPGKAWAQIPQRAMFHPRGPLGRCWGC